MTDKQFELLNYAEGYAPNTWDGIDGFLHRIHADKENGATFTLLVDFVGQLKTYDATDFFHGLSDYISSLDCCPVERIEDLEGKCTELENRVDEEEMKAHDADSDLDSLRKELLALADDVTMSPESLREAIKSLGGDLRA